MLRTRSSWGGLLQPEAMKSSRFVFTLLLQWGSADRSIKFCVLRIFFCVKTGIEEANVVARISVLQGGVWARFRSSGIAKNPTVHACARAPFRTYGEHDANCLLCLDIILTNWIPVNKDGRYGYKTIAMPKPPSTKTWRHCRYADQARRIRRRLYLCRGEGSKYVYQLYNISLL